MRHWVLIANFVVAAVMWPLLSYAQQPTQVVPKRVGILSIFQCPTPPDHHPVHRRLTELGWIEGQTFVFDCVSTVGRLDQLGPLSRELVSRRPAVLIAGPTPFVKALKQETTIIPIVMLGSLDPLGTGIITSLARPGGNVTGVTFFGIDIITKRVELLKEIVPQLRRLAIIGGMYGSDDPKAIETLKANTTIAASRLDFAWKFFQVATAMDYDEIFARLATEHFDAAYVTSAPFNIQNGARIVDLARRHLMPAIGEGAGWARDGLLLAYGQDFNFVFVRASEYVDKILRGAKPSELPVEQATKFELVINLKTAKALGLTIPPTLLARADEVIE